MNRRGFLVGLASIAPTIFIPKLIKVTWPMPRPVVVPLAMPRDGVYYFKGVRYPVYFSRIMSPVFTKDIDKLRGYDYDIRQILST